MTPKDHCRVRLWVREKRQRIRDGAGAQSIYAVRALISAEEKSTFPIGLSSRRYETRQRRIYCVAPARCSLRPDAHHTATRSAAWTRSRAESSRFPPGPCGAGPGWDARASNERRRMFLLWTFF